MAEDSTDDEHSYAVDPKEYEAFPGLFEKRRPL